MRPNLLPIAATLLVAALSAACDSSSGPPPIRLHAADTAIGLLDTMTVAISGDGRVADSIAAGAVTWRSSDTLIVPLLTATDRGMLVGGLDTGRAWVIADVAGQRDSISVTVERRAVRASGYAWADSHPFNDGMPGYYPVDGMCSTATNEQFRQIHGRDFFFTQLGAWVADAYRRPLERGGVQWDFSNPTVAYAEVHPDSVQDRLVRPEGNGHTRIRMITHGHVAEINYFVDGINECRGIVGRGSVGATHTVLSEPVPGVKLYVWGPAGG